MTATTAEAPVYRLGEFHSFEAAGQRFLYLVPAGAIFQVDEAVGALIDCLSGARLTGDQLIDGLIARGLEADDAKELVVEMAHASVIASGKNVPEPVQSPPADFPLQTLVLNLTNECNL